MTNAYCEVGRLEFLGPLEEKFSPDQVEEIEAAYAFSKYGHKGQFRDNGQIRYFEHPKSVAYILIDELQLFDPELIITALLHDVAFEDSFILSKKRIKINFGPKVLSNLEILSKNVSSDYYTGLKKADWNVILVKLCDRLHNLRTLNSCSPEKQLRQIKETKKHYLPLCEILISKLPDTLKYAGEYLKKSILDEITGFE